MELWIRSQQKTNLYKIDNINMDDNDYTLYYQLSWGQIELGTYKSKERALEVLDEIQNILLLKDMYVNDKETLLKGWEKFNQDEIKAMRTKLVVYEMPQE